MRIKLDENLSPHRIKPLFADAGWDVQTTGDEGLDGADDDTVARAAMSERRVLVTLDLHFGDVRRFAMEQHPGIILLRPGKLGRSGITHTAQQAVEMLKTRSVEQQLWVVEPHRVRVRRDLPLS